MPRRTTKAQVAVLEILKAADAALCHDDIMHRLTDTMDRVTLYRILNRFVEDGRAHRIVAADGRQYFARSPQTCSHGEEDHGHVHFRCVVCNRVECLPGSVEYDVPAGYQVENQNIVISGSCAKCGE